MRGAVNLIGFIVVNVSLVPHIDLPMRGYRYALGTALVRLGDLKGSTGLLFERGCNARPAADTNALSTE